MSKTQSQSSDNRQKLTATPIEDDKGRTELFRKLFGVRAYLVEQYVYTWLDFLCKRYNGGFWHIYALSNDAFYMAPKSDDVFDVMCPGFGGDVQLSADAAGLVACLYAVNKMTHQFVEDSIIKLYYRILDYAGEHPEAARIFRAID
jgi:hypothetical protein